jgi:hypothetical protein
MNRRTTLAMTTMALLCLGVALPTNAAVAQTAKDLVGTWTIVSSKTDQGGRTSDIFGPNGKGLAIFESNGRYSIVNVNPDVPKFASNNRAQGTAAENKAAVEASIAHFGTYSYDAANKVINFKIEGSTYPNWTSTDQKRTIISFAGDDLKWTNAASAGGTATVTWKRAK